MDIRDYVGRKYRDHRGEFSILTLTNEKYADDELSVIFSIKYNEPTNSNITRITLGYINAHCQEIE